MQRNDEDGWLQPLEGKDVIELEGKDLVQLRTHAIIRGNVTEIKCPKCRKGLLQIIQITSRKKARFGWGSEPEVDTGLICSLSCNNENCKRDFFGLVGYGSAGSVAITAAT